jgi:hypothetical protein
MTYYGKRLAKVLLFALVNFAILITGLLAIYGAVRLAAKWGILS